MKSSQFEKITEAQAWSAECSPSERLVLLAIAKLQAKGENSSCKNLAALTGLLYNSVNRLRLRLEKKGLLRKIAAPPRTKKVTPQRKSLRQLLYK